MSDMEKSGNADKGSPATPGIQILPDASKAAALQKENLQKMTEAVTAAASGLQCLVKAQQDALQQTLGGLQKSLSSSVTAAGVGSSPFPDMNLPVANLTKVMEGGNAAAEILSKSLTDSFESLQVSAEKSEATIQQVEQKFPAKG